MGLDKRLCLMVLVLIAQTSQEDKEQVESNVDQILAWLTKFCKRMVHVDSVTLMKKLLQIRRAASHQNVESDQCLCKMVHAQYAQTGLKVPQMEDHADQIHAH